MVLLFLEGVGGGGLGHCYLEERVSVQVIMVVLKNVLQGFVVQIARKLRILRLMIDD